MRNNNEKVEIRVSVDGNFLKTLENRLGLSRSTDVTRIALSLLDWVSDETYHDRMILSTTRDGSDAHRLVMPELSRIKKQNAK